MISIIIPCYNQYDTLPRALESVCLQNFTDWEILCIDDGSERIFHSIIEKSLGNKFHYYHLPHGNANIARNYGILHANGEYIAMLDADDEWKANHLELALKRIEETNADGVYGSIFIKNNNFEKTFLTRHLRENEAMVDFLLATGCGAQTSTLVMTSISARTILWDETLLRHQDYDFVTRYSQRYKWEYVSEPTVIYYCSSITALQCPDYKSCIQFIEQNKQDISPQIYAEYSRQMYHHAIKHYASDKIISYYHQASIPHNENKEEILKRIAENNLFKRHCQKKNGLFHGRMGMAVFFFLYARHTDSRIYEDFAGNLIDDIYDDISTAMPVGLKDGLCGIGWGIEYLVQQRYLEGNTDEILEDIDLKIMEKDLRRITDYSLENGLEGILWYALMRLTSPYSKQAFDEAYRHDLKTACMQYPSFISTLLLETFNGKKVAEYPHWQILSHLLSVSNNEELSWKNGLNILL